ncbi:hypothetical protein OF83DRAFT_1040658, partial [Amylostereum chailletii]
MSAHRVASQPFDGSTRVPSNLVLISSDDVVFKIHATRFYYASPVFWDILTSSPVTETLDGIRIVRLEDTSTDLDFVLRFAYPGPKPVLDTTPRVQIALDMGRKYQVYTLRGAVEKAFQADFKTLNVAGVFFLALEYGEYDIAERAATHSLTIPIFDLYSLIPATATVDLLLTYHK